MTVTASETELRERIAGVLNTEFTTEGITFRMDRAHDSLGQDAPVGAVYPGPSEEKLGQGLVYQTTAYIQLFRQWDPRVDPTQTVDPADIENWAERARRALQLDGVSVTGDAHLWYYRVVKTEYPLDPTGNVSRALFTVIAESQNASLVETHG